MITKQQLRPMCSLCGTRPARGGGVSVSGYKRWRKHCASCDSAIHRKPRQVDLKCSVCNWVAVDACQIDVVDDQSICACCNRLKMKRNKQQEHENFELTVDATVNLDDVRL